ncbi:formylglycine-generating enzyme family protein [Trichlorobacter lovleyi]|uniref:formylglycine-generating enzyme family protein n=1 Tax=Trichlorobacter lovleyi TaxID=313985 RepID=UPI0022402B6F|nr:formylglycine-generating enzyme family protein [Trichlorobacter lovleyi]QOX77969.1 formylglycine-generating enzyme family protein [Trichlorobacter lovleyi]
MKSGSISTFAIIAAAMAISFAPLAARAGSPDNTGAPSVGSTVTATGGKTDKSLAVKTPVPQAAKVSHVKPGNGYREPMAAGMAFVNIPGGCYRMGDSFGHGLEGELPVHEVCVDDFALGKGPVTVGEFRAFVKATGYKTEAERRGGCGIWTFAPVERVRFDPKKNWQAPGFPQDDRHPVVCVTWNDADAYAAWLARASGIAYRLPTEAEYEYAARSGGKPYEYAWGSGPVSANVYDEAAMQRFLIKSKPESALYRGYDDGYAYTSPVGSFKPNELGLFDMAGNVCVWLADRYGETYYADSPRDNPTGPASGSQRMLRGSTWADDKRQTRTPLRIWYAPQTNSNDTGMRLAGPVR